MVFFFNLYFWTLQIISFEYFRLTGLIKNWILYHVWQLMCTENFYFHPDKIPIPKFWTFKKFPNIWQVLGGLFTHLPLHPHHWMTTKATILASQYQRGCQGLRPEPLPLSPPPQYSRTPSDCVENVGATTLAHPPAICCLQQVICSIHSIG